MSQLTDVSALIGDVVDSRGFDDRAGLQSSLITAFAAIGVEAIQAPMMTVGDEFQAIYPDLESALEAELRLRALLAKRVLVRIGMGCGQVNQVEPDREPFGQDGSAWWRAREALEWVAETEESNSTATWRTAARTGDSRESWLNRLLVLRSAVLEELDQTDGEILLGLLDGVTVSAIAEQIGLNKSSVSRRARRHGLWALVESRNR